MLVELNISNYAVIDRLTVAFGPGFNVLTGETGAGKSIILDALGLLLGDKADPGAVRAGEPQAYVEGIFEPAAGAAADLSDLLELDVAGDGLIVAREVNASGRSVCRINGRAFPQRRLAEIGALLVDVHGQSEHLSLLRPREHVDLLDRYAGLTELRGRYAAVVRSLNRTLKELQALDQAQADAEQRKDYLTFQAQEIDAAALKPGEEEELLAERNLRVNALRIHELVGEAQGALEGDGSELPGAVEMIGRAVQALAALERIDPTGEAFRVTAQTAALQLEELVRDLRGFAEGVEFDQQRLTAIEERLELIASLKRKYGSTVDEILAFETRVNQELLRLSSHGASVAGLEAAGKALREEAAALAGELSSARRKAACDLTRGVEEQLAGLGMEGARMAVSFGVAADPVGLPVGLDAPPEPCVVASGAVEPASGEVADALKFDATGVDRVEFLISSNPGEPLRPLASIASGGETSRLMLAIKGVLSQADAVPVLVFDEIDAGIGGKVGEAVGRRLWSLGRHHQVVAVTHLPQIAAYGDRHLSVRKAVAGGRTTTQVVAVEGEDRVAELTVMLGSDTEATRMKA
ncbi:MAG TPA: DNA repair protein RecN, partial [Actinomycetota bacterium]|nr:DNA repair protein RecN [Actinomycetota bacterium]